MHESFETFRVECQCSSFHHNVRFTLDKEEGDVYVDVVLSSYLPWYKRLWRGMMYVVYPGKSGHYEDVVLEPKDYDRITDLLNRSKEILKRNKEINAV